MTAYIFGTGKGKDWHPFTNYQVPNTIILFGDKNIRDRIARKKEELFIMYRMWTQMWKVRRFE